MLVKSTNGPKSNEIHPEDNHLAMDTRCYAQLLQQFFHTHFDYRISTAPNNM